MADVNQRAKDSVGGIKNLPGSIVRAERERRAAGNDERGESGDTTFTFVREVGPAGNYSKVLDAQMLSDNERDPGSKYQIPPVSGSISASSFSMTGGLPTGPSGDRMSV